MNTDERNKTKDVLIKTLAVVGVIAIVVAGLWGTVQVVRFIPKVVSAAAVTLTSIFRPAESIEISVPSLTLPHSEVFTLSWQHFDRDEDDEGKYTISYTCHDNFIFETFLPNGTFSGVSCNTQFNFVDAENEIQLIPISEENRFLDVQITVTFTSSDTDADPISDEVLLTIENKNFSDSPDSTNGNGININGTSAGVKSEETRQISGGGAVSDPNGRIDLAVRILEVGYVEGVDNTFHATSSVERRLRTAVRFEVENLGTKTSPQWFFNVVLPTKTLYVFSSKIQPELGPGDRIEYTIGFDKIKAGPTEIVTINADPTNSINEVSKSNNIAKATIEVFTEK